jgi:hypothetical protein
MTPKGSQRRWDRLRTKTTAGTPPGVLIALSMYRWYRLGPRPQLDHRLMADKPPACMSHNGVQRIRHL